MASSSRPSQYTIPNRDSIRNALPEVAPSWRFIAVMPQIDQQVGSNYQFSSGGGASYSSAPTLSTPQIPIAVCESVDIPPIQLDTDQRFGGGKKINVVRSVSTSPLTLNFYEDNNYSVSKYLWAWFTLVVDKSNLYGLPKDCKKDIKVWAFDSFNNYAPVVMYDFTECMPVNPVGGLSYSMSDNGFLKVSCEFTVDNQDFQFNGSTAPSNNTTSGQR